MSCHYSCSGCSEPVYYDSCLGCPSTRYLQSGVCYCLSGFRDTATSDCIQCTIQPNIASETFYDITLKVLYYFSIIMYFIVLLSMLVRYRLTLTKRLIDVAQSIALCLYFRWNFSTLSRSSFAVVDNYNFVFANAYCNKATPPLYCTGFENLIAPGIVLGSFAILYFVAYCIVYFRHPETVTFKLFHRQNFQNVLMVYLNSTIILNTLALGRIAYYSMWALLLIGPYLILVLFCFRAFYRVVNNPVEQAKLLYRTQHCLLFLYDQNYHINYIDHLYDEVEFRVRSNFLLLEMLFKLLWAGSLIVNYKYKPGLVAYILVLLLWIAMLRIRLFFKYENLKLLSFFFLDAILLAVVTTFWMDLFQQFAFYGVCVLQGLIIVAYVWEMIINRFQMKVQNKVFIEPSERTSQSEQIEPEPNKEVPNNPPAAKNKNVLENTSNDLLLVDV